MWKVGHENTDQSCFNNLEVSETNVVDFFVLLHDTAPIHESNKV